MNKQHYRLTDGEFSRLIEASKPVPYMVFNGVPPESPAERALRLWHDVAERVGCIVSTIGPADTGDDKDFMAVSKEPLT